MKTGMIAVGMAVLFLGAAVVVSAAGKGAAEIELNGGSPGNVSFPHHAHQAVIEDCNTCHALFPQSDGSIDTLKAKGELRRKHIMNKLCIKCHREKKNAGVKAGPLTCKGCHVR